MIFANNFAHLASGRHRTLRPWVDLIKDYLHHFDIPFVVTLNASSLEEIECENVTFEYTDKEMNIYHKVISDNGQNRGIRWTDVQCGIKDKQGLREHVMQALCRAHYSTEVRKLLHLPNYMHITTQWDDKAHIYTHHIGVLLWAEVDEIVAPENEVVKRYCFYGRQGFRVIGMSYTADDTTRVLGDDFYFVQQRKKERSPVGYSIGKDESLMLDHFNAFDGPYTLVPVKSRQHYESDFVVPQDDDAWPAYVVMRSQDVKLKPIEM